MNKLLYWGISSLVAIIFLSGATVAIGITNDYSSATVEYQEKIRAGKIDDSVIMSGIKLDNKSRDEIEAMIKAGNIRCTTLPTEAQRLACGKQLEATVKAKMHNMTNAQIAPAINDKSDSMKPTVMEDKIKNAEVRNKDNQKQFGDFSTRLENVILNFVAVHDRIAKLGDRIESRMKKLSEENINVTESMKLTAEARAELKLAKTEIENVRNIFNQEQTINTNNSTQTNPAVATEAFKKCKSNGGVIEVSGTNAKCSLGGTTYMKEDPSVSDNTEKNHRVEFTKTIESIRSIKEHLKNAHALLVRAIVGLKPGINKNTESDIKVETNSNGANTTSGTRN